MLALFNIADDGPATIDVSWNELGISGQCVVRDLWQKKDIGRYETGFRATVPIHGGRLYRVSRTKWTGNRALFS